MFLRFQRSLYFLNIFIQLSTDILLYFIKQEKSLSYLNEKQKIRPKKARYQFRHKTNIMGEAFLYKCNKENVTKIDEAVQKMFIHSFKPKFQFVKINPMAVTIEA